VLRLGFAVIGVVDMARAVAFWTAALNLVASEEWQSDDWVTLYHADGSGRALGLQRSQSPVEAHPRVHLDLFVETAAEQQAEVERLVDSGQVRSTGDCIRRSRTSSSSATRTAIPSA